MHAVAFFAAMINNLAITYKLISVPLLLVSLFYYLKHSNQQFIIRHKLLSGWEIAFIENHFITTEILPSTVISPYLIVLHYKQENQKKRTALICKDALHKDEYRKLVVELKIAGLKKDSL